MTNQYIGPDKVVGITKHEITTPLGNEVVKVILDNGKEKLMTKKCFDLLVTETPPPGDYNYLQEKKFSVLVPMVIDLINEYDLGYFEIGRFGQKIVDELFERFHRASNFLWNASDEHYVAGFEFMNNKTVLDALHIIHKIPKKDVETKSDVGDSTEIKSGESGEAKS